MIALKPNLALPAHPHVETWSLPDPEGWDLDGIRPLRGDLDSRVRGLLKTMLASTSPMVGDLNRA